MAVAFQRYCDNFVTSQFHNAIFFTSMRDHWLPLFRQVRLNQSLATVLILTGLNRTSVLKLNHSSLPCFIVFFNEIQSRKTMIIGVS